MADNENTPETQAPQKEPGALSKFWRSGPMLPVRLTYGAVDWTAVRPLKAAFKVAAWGLKRESTIMKTAAPVAAAIGVAAYFGTLSYGAMYGAVAVGDHYWFGQPYASGDRTGKISKLSVVGKWPCDSVEGELAMPNLGSGGSSTFTFSARSLGPINDSTIADLKKAYESGETVSLTYDQSHWPTEWFDRESEGWFLPHANFGCFQKTDYNIVDVKMRPGVTMPEPPRLPNSPR